MHTDGFNSLFEVTDFSEDNLVIALSNEHTTVDYIRKGKYHFNFFYEYLLYKNRTGYKVKTILVERKYISHTYLSDLGAEFIYSSQDYSKFCKRIHFFSERFTSVEEIIKAPESNKADRIWKSYRGFITVKPLPKARLGPVILEHFPPSAEPDGLFTVVRPYTIHLLGQSIQIQSLAFLEQDGILSACSTVALWSTIHRLHTMFNVGILRPVAINSLAKYTAHNQPGALPGLGMDLHQICGVLEQIGLRAELRTLNGNSSNYKSQLANEEPKDITFVRKFIYAYLKMGLPVLLGLEYKNGGKHLITLTGYKKPKALAINPLKTSQPLTYADGIQELDAHDDQVGPFSPLKLEDAADVLKTYRWNKNAAEDIIYNESLVYCIITPLSRDIRLTFEDIYQQIYYFENLFTDLFGNLKDRFIWDIYLMSTNDYRKEVLRNKDVFTDDQKNNLLENFLPPYLWVARAEVSGYQEMEFIFDATAIPYSDDFCIDVMFFDDALKELIARKLNGLEEYDKDTYLYINKTNQFINSKVDSAYIWYVVKEALKNDPGGFDISEEKIEDHIHEWRQMIAKANIENVLQQISTYINKYVEPKYDEIILLQARFNEFKNKDRKGIISTAEYSLATNQIAASLLDLINELKSARS